MPEVDEIEMVLARAPARITVISVFFDTLYILRVHYNEETGIVWFLDLDHESGEPQGSYYLYEPKCLTPGVYKWTQAAFGEHLMAMRTFIQGKLESEGPSDQVTKLVSVLSSIDEEHARAFLENRVPFCGSL